MGLSRVIAKSNSKKTEVIFPIVANNVVFILKASLFSSTSKPLVNNVKGEKG